MIRTIVIDDEEPSLQRMERQLADSGMAQAAAVFTKPRAALDYLKENRVDAVFLDIEMPDMDGIELASRIFDFQADISIVFVTAYNQYAVEAFRLNAIDYLLKPVSADRLRETLGRIGKAKDISIHSGPLRVTCFGKFGVTAGTSEVRFRTEKAAELMAFLIDCRGSFVSRSRIIDSLWEEFDGDRALIHLNTTLHNIKKALLPFGVKLPVKYDMGGYRMDVGGLDCDYLKYCSFIDKTVKAGQKNITDLEEIAALHSREYLSGWDSSWVAGKRLILEEQFAGLMLGIADYYRNQGNYQKSAKWLRDGLLREPLHRELNYRLVEALLLAHEGVLASKHYELYRNGLKRKLGLEPDEGFKKLLIQHALGNKP